MKLENIIKKTIRNVVGSITAISIVATSIYGCDCRTCEDDSCDVVESFVDSSTGDYDLGNGLVDVVEDIIDISQKDTTEIDQQKIIDAKNDEQDCYGSQEKFCKDEKRVFIEECSGIHKLVETCDLTEQCLNGECISNVICVFYKEFGFEKVELANENGIMEEKCCTEGNQGDVMCLTDVFTYGFVPYGSIHLSGTQGITWNNEFLFSVSGDYNGKLYKIKNDGEVLDSIEMEYANTIAWDGKNLWTSYKGENYGEYGIKKLSPSLEVLEGILVDTGYIRGLTWDENNLWVLESIGGTNDTIHKIEIVDEEQKLGVVDYSIHTDYNQLAGLEWKNNQLWTCDIHNNKILVYGLNGDVANSYNAPMDHCRDLAWEGNYLWITQNSNNRPPLMKLEIIKN